MDRVEVNAPQRSNRNTVLVPKYQTVESLLGMDNDPEDQQTKSRLSRDEIAALADDLLKNPNAARDFLLQ